MKALILYIIFIISVIHCQIQGLFSFSRRNCSPVNNLRLSQLRACTVCHKGLHWNAYIVNFLRSSFLLRSALLFSLKTVMWHLSCVLSMFFGEKTNPWEADKMFVWSKIRVKELIISWSSGSVERENHFWCSIITWKVTLDVWRGPP